MTKIEKSFPHIFPVRVYYEDTDAAGVVYHSNYLKFAERARTEALRNAGFNQSELLSGSEKIGFAMRRCVVDFFKPARLDDLLTIHTRLHDINKVSMSMQQMICKGDEKLVSLEVKIAVVGNDMKLAKMPDAIKKAIMRELEE